MNEKQKIEKAQAQEEPVHPDDRDRVESRAGGTRVYDRDGKLISSGEPRGEEE